MATLSLDGVPAALAFVIGVGFGFVLNDFCVSLPSCGFGLPDVSEGKRARDTDYRAARIGAAITLTLVVATVVLLDALDPAYEANAIILAGLLGTIVTLLGIEARAIVDAVRRED